MQLSVYLAEQGINRSEFASRIGATQAAVSRYASGLRIPRPRLMREIERETKGLVTANDFFAASAAPKQTEAA